MPLVIAYNPNNYGCLAFRMDAERMKASLDQVHKIFSHLYPYYIYDLTFLDERVESFYTAQLVTSSLFKVFAFLAIFISCLGLYGLISFMAVQKTKEVGIRKVLGASVQNIVYLFSREFTPADPGGLCYRGPPWPIILSDTGGCNRIFIIISALAGAFLYLPSPCRS